MFGRAGRRGLDEAGYALVTPEVPRLHEAFPLKLKRAGTDRLALFSGGDECCGLSWRRSFPERTRTFPTTVFHENADARGRALLRWRHHARAAFRVDGERGRFVRRHQEKMQNSRGRWQNQPRSDRDNTSEISWYRRNEDRWRPALTVASTSGWNRVWQHLQDPDGSAAVLYMGAKCPVRRCPGERVASGKVATEIAPRTVPSDQRENGTSRRRILSARWCPWLPGRWGVSYGIWSIEKNWWWRDFASTVCPHRGYLDEFGHWLADPQTKRDYPEVCRDCEFRGRVRRNGAERDAGARMAAARFDR